MDLDLQCELFKLVLETLETLEAEGVDLANMALDVFHKADGSVECVIYDIPASPVPAGVMPPAP
ncbi:MAG TPA: hypothetical protein VJN44_08620 [Roseateles sp.]|nr:hypothetical protein [Roseateles sp.]